MKTRREELIRAVMSSSAIEGVKLTRREVMGMAKKKTGKKKACK